jgi:hypothetical protein
MRFPMQMQAAHGAARSIMAAGMPQSLGRAK